MLMMKSVCFYNPVDLPPPLVPSVFRNDLKGYECAQGGWSWSGPVFSSQSTTLIFPVALINIHCHI